MFFWNQLEQLLAPLSGKPALLSAVVIAITFASLDSPDFAFALLLPLIFMNHVFPRFLQWVILLSLTAGIVFHEISLDTASTPSGTAAKEMLVETGCGLVESSQVKASGQAIIIKTTDSANAGKRVRLTEKRDLPIYPLPGDSICYEASWYPVNPPTVPGGFDTKGWLRSQGLSGYGKFKHWTVFKHHWVPERSFYSFRKWIEKRFAQYLQPAETGLLLGLLAGDRSGIPDALRSDFQRSGLVHVLAISGFHVVLLAGMLMVFLKATGLPHHVVRIVAIILLLVYIPVTGGSPAVRRAVLMFAVPQIGALFQRNANTLNSLGVALLFIMLPEPAVIWNPGFQLSVAATMGILISGPMNPLKKIPSPLKKNKLWNLFQNYVLDPTYVTLCATLSTAPFLIHHFKTLSPFAWLGNIVVVPAISMGMQAGLFALISPLDFLRENFCYAAQFFLRLASLLTNILSDSAQASVTVGPFGPGILLLCGLAVVLLPLCRANKLARFYGMACILIFSFIFAGGGLSNASHPSWKITTIDIGQGDSHLITTPSGKRILVDAGDSEILGGKGKKDSGKDVIVPYLHHIGVSSLDALIITHPDLDHYGGSLSIIKTFPVKELWITDCARIEGKDSWQKIIAQAYKRGVVIRDIGQGFLWKENFFELKVLHPDTRTCYDANTQSITFRVKGLGHSAIFTGDLTVAGEKEILKKDLFLQSDVLKLGHHGSKTSSSAVFLKAVSPRLAIISSGRRNRFRHPSKKVIQRLDSLSIPYLNTAGVGTIDIIFKEDSLEVKTMLEPD
ncbi:MAG: DNA internalization-related competence protein ComEC/Rec2 [Fibrobacter sp.]|nr:DNA internalization-related competence protein ComEC/Rec2 [Fibrobacter sp.]